jgi:hypothetical protein
MLHHKKKFGRLTQRLLLAAVLVSLGSVGLRAADPAQFDPSKKNDQLAPTPEQTDTRLAPNQEANQRPIERNDLLQDQRFKAPDKVERKDAVVGEKRAPIDIKEAREKNVIERKDVPKPELKTWDKNRHNGEKFGRQPSGDDVKKYDMADKYQGRMTDAKTAAAQRQPKMEKRTTFESINRFLFKRNGPGSADGKAMVTPAAGGPNPPPSQDTYKKYSVDWSKGQTIPVE